MKRIIIDTKESKPQKIAVRQQNLAEWRRKTKIRDLIKQNRLFVNSLVS